MVLRGWRWPWLTRTPQHPGRGGRKVWEGSRDTAQMQPDPDTTGARWGRAGRGGCWEQAVGGAQGTSDPRSETRLLSCHTLALDGDLCDAQFPKQKMVLAETPVSSRLADAVQCPSEEVGTGSSARSPVPPAPPTAPVHPPRAGTHVQAAMQLKNLGSSNWESHHTSWDNTSRSHPHLHIPTHTGHSPLQSRQQLPIESLEQLLRGCPQTQF